MDVEQALEKLKSVGLFAHYIGSEYVTIAGGVAFREEMFGNKTFTLYEDPMFTILCKDNRCSVIVEDPHVPYDHTLDEDFNTLEEAIIYLCDLLHNQKPKP